MTLWSVLLPRTHLWPQSKYGIGSGCLRCVKVMAVEHKSRIAWRYIRVMKCGIALLCSGNQGWLDFTNCANDVALGRSLRSCRNIRCPVTIRYSLITHCNCCYEWNVISRDDAEYSLQLSEWGPLTVLRLSCPSLNPSLHTHNHSVNSRASGRWTVTFCKPCMIKCSFC